MSCFWIIRFMKYSVVFRYGLSAFLSRSTNFPFPRDIPLNCPRAMASSIFSFARELNPWTLAGMGRAPGVNRSRSSFRRDSRSFSDMLLSWLKLYVDVRSRALEIRSPGDFLGSEAGWRMIGGPTGLGILYGTLIGLLASSSIRRAESWRLSVPVHAVAEAISWVPWPAEDWK